MLFLQHLLMQLKSPRTWVAILVAAVVAGGFVYYKNSIEFDPGADVNLFTTGEQLLGFYKKLEKLHEKDTYGGATAEETIQLFVDALKKGDINLASKYFVPQKQKWAFSELQIAMTSGWAVMFLKSYEINDRDTEFIDYMNRYRIFFNTEDGNLGFVFELGFNETTKVWKILDF